MAQRYPNNMLAMDESGCLIQGGVLMKVNRGGMTPLHVACSSLLSYKEDNMKEACKYLITSCPESAQSFDSDSRLPIHQLTSLDYVMHPHQSVREVAVCLLREYPESYNMKLRRLSSLGDGKAHQVGLHLSDISSPSWTRRRSLRRVSISYE